jgi:hypothetical protein
LTEKKNKMTEKQQNNKEELGKFTKVLLYGIAAFSLYYLVSNVLYSCYQERKEINKIRQSNVCLINVKNIKSSGADFHSPLEEYEKNEARGIKTPGGKVEISLRDQQRLNAGDLDWDSFNKWGKPSLESKFIRFRDLDGDHWVDLGRFGKYFCE